MYPKRLFLLAAVLSAIAAYNAAAQQDDQVDDGEAQQIEEEVTFVKLLNESFRRPSEAEKEDPDDPRVQKTIELYRLHVEAERHFKDGRLGQAYQAYSRIAKQVPQTVLEEYSLSRIESILSQGRATIAAALEMDDLVDTYRRISSLYPEYWHTPLRAELLRVRRQLEMKSAKTLIVGERPDDEAAALDREAKRYLIMGNIHQLNARPKEAEQAYRTLIYDYPDSRFAEEARMRLDDIRFKAVAAQGEKE